MWVLTETSLDEMDTEEWVIALPDTRIVPFIRNKIQVYLYTKTKQRLTVLT